MPLNIAAENLLTCFGEQASLLVLKYITRAQCVFVNNNINNFYAFQLMMS